MTDDPNRVDAGRFYTRTFNGPLKPASPGPPDVWICRRIVDYPNGTPPARAELDTCSQCSALIAYNPARVAEVPPNTKKICMQCGGIRPLAIEGEPHVRR